MYRNSVKGARPAQAATLAFTLVSLLIGPDRAFGANPEEPGSGCVAVSQPEYLSQVKNLLTPRRELVSIGVTDSTPLLQQLRTLGNTVSIQTFLNFRENTPGLTSNSFLLLVNAKRVSPGKLRAVAAISKAIAFNVPIVVENHTSDHIKALSGLGIDSKGEAVVVQSQPGSRAFTISILNKPPTDLTPAFVENAVNRALQKHSEFVLLGDDPGAPTRQAYATYAWNVWLRNGNVVCQPPYDPEHPMDPQIANVDFGIQVTLVAGTNPTQKAVNFQYIGTGFTPLAPEVVPIDDNSLFKGAYTLELNYEGKLVAPSDAKLASPAQAVVPTVAVNEHTVTITSGWNVGVTAGCGGGKGGPNCSVNASFNWGESKTTSKTIAERVINASSNFGNTAQGTEADHSIQYLLSSTAVSDQGAPVGLSKNDWYGFFAHGTKESACFINGSWEDAEKGDCPAGTVRDGREKFPSDDNPRVRAWPDWAKSDAMTDGMAAYTMDADFTGDLTLTASFTAKEGVFALGNGAHGSRQKDTSHLGACGDFGACPWWEMHLYTDSFQAAQQITIDAGNVNYSGMPTCAMQRYTQADIGIWQVLNKTNYPVDISKMWASPLAGDKTIPTVLYDYVGSQYFLIGVSGTQINPGQYEYAALCADNNEPQNEPQNAAMSLLYENRSSDGTVNFKGAINFDALGNVVSNNDPHIVVDTIHRVITVAAGNQTGTTVRSDHNPSTLGQQVMFTAAVAPLSGSGQPTGSVIFEDNGTRLGDAVALTNGQATLSTTSLMVGAHPITAIYSGDSTFPGSTSPALNQEVKSATVTPAFSSLTPSQSVALGTANISLSGVISASGLYPPANEQVTVAIGGVSQSASIGAQGAFTFNRFPIGTLAAGDYEITYAYYGDTSFHPATDNSTRLTVKSAGDLVDTTTRVTASVQKCVTGSPFQLFITVTPMSSTAGAPNGQVALSRNNPDGSITALGSQFLDSQGEWNPDLNGSNDSIPPGTYTFVATYQGSQKFQASSGSLTLTCTAQ